MRVGKREARRVKEEPLDRRRKARRRTRRSSLAVEAIAENRKSEGGQVRAHLVAKTGGDPRPDEDQPPALFEELDLGCIAPIGSLRRRAARAAPRAELPDRPGRQERS